MSVGGLVNTVFQVVQNGLVMILYRITQSDQAGCPLHFQWDFKEGDNAFAFSSLGLAAVINGPSRVDYSPMNADVSVLTPAFDFPTTASSSTSASSSTERYVSADVADKLSDGNALKNLVFQDATRVDQLFPAGTKQITQNALNSIVATVDTSSPLRRSTFFQKNVIEAFLGSNFGDLQQAKPSSTEPRAKSVSLLWGSSYGAPGFEIISNDLLLQSLVTLQETWDAISGRKSGNGRGFFSEAMAGILDLFNPLRLNVLPFSPAFNSVWIQEMVLKVANVMRAVRPVTLTEGELVKELTSIFFAVSHEQLAIKYRLWTEKWPLESQLWLQSCVSSPLSTLPVFGGLSISSLGADSASSSASGSGEAPPAKKLKVKKAKVAKVVVPVPAPVVPAALILPVGNSGGGGGSGSTTRARGGAKTGVYPGKLCQYHVRHLFCNGADCKLNLNIGPGNPGCKFIHQDNVNSYHKNDMLAWADVALSGHSDFDAVVSAIKKKA